MNKEKYLKKDFIFEEDYAIEGECQSCGWVTYSENEAEEGHCEECGSDDVLCYTSHEDMECAICGMPFMTYEDGYIHNVNSEIIICCDCYAELE